MCRRFMAIAVNLTGSSDEAGPEAAGRSIGLMSSLPHGATWTLPIRAAAGMEAVDVAADAIDEARSAFSPSASSLCREGNSE